MLTFCLHDITKSPSGEFDIRPDELTGILETTVAHGLPLLSVRQVVDAAQRTLNPPGVCLIFDDGYRSTLECAGPLMTTYGCSFGLAAVPRHLIDGDPHYLTLREVEAWTALGGELLGHTYSHADLSALSDTAEIESELDRELQFYASHGLPRPDSFCYPYGRSSAAAQEQVEHRYASGFRTGDGGDEVFNIHRLSYRRSRFDGLDPSKILSSEFGHRQEKMDG
ncbi:polysaccharide deacetylase family protein [Streptomyces sp. WAC05858]|uniref:polysaccharide deacetylase family protein n=1 Tax=Streptomyces TaxID=1883 RepID=UPI000F77A50C|nr:polysaccharide deacetylase family protein [Streptomyces sp. WAC05858]RSS35049.1 hypothetical protein EF902_38960 [Streptomyces sp. WAC05858]WTB04028.1 polysaccharide deacetylase family protein [Streptomyces antimycoticus]